jgi:hypothetical protein
MTDSTPTSPRGTDAPGEHFTVEDAGSTSDPADLTDDGTASSGTSTGTARAVRADELPDRDADVAGGGTTGSAATGTASTGTDSTGSASTGTERDGLAALAGDDDSIGHVFDQTNGVIDGLEGDSDGSAEGDEHSAAERGDENPSFFRRDDAPRNEETEDSRRTGA